MDVSLSKLQEMVMDREAWSYVGHGVTGLTWQRDWTATTDKKIIPERHATKQGGKKTNKKTTNQTYNLSQNELKDLKKKNKSTPRYIILNLQEIRQTLNLQKINSMQMQVMRQWSIFKELGRKLVT